MCIRDRSGIEPKGRPPPAIVSAGADATRRIGRCAPPCDPDLASAAESSTAKRAQRRFSSGIGHRLTKVTAVKLDARETAAVAITDLRKRATCKIGRMPNAIPGRFRARIPLHSGDFCDSAKGFPVKHGQQTGEAASGFRRPSSTLRWLQPERNVTARSGPFLMESIERTEARSHAVFKRRAQWKAASDRKSVV